MTYLVFNSKDSDYALEISKIQEIAPIRVLEPVQVKSPWVKGATKIRSKFFYIFDFRKILGLPTILEERQQLVEILNQRERDHVEWLDALYKAITEKTEFTKAKDPTKCNFGKWYYSYKAPDATIRRLLDQFEEPHNRIHSLAEKLLTLAETDQQKAVEILEDEKRFTLAKMIKLFAELRQVLINNIRSLLIVLGPVFDSAVVIEVDAIDNLRNLDKENLEVRNIKTDNNLINKVWVNDKTTIYGIDYASLYGMLCDIQYPSNDLVRPQI
ncbi:MAG: CZB domain-containing protein [Deltaproteobacteria bacterium]|nr:CZB domain-containing protein [Deltaproteobacteria bacterium]